jgi:SSS family solute:Na+ symporter
MLPGGTWLFFTVIAYFVAIIIVGLLSRNRAGDEDGFFLADRRLGFWQAMGSLAATAIGGSSTILVIGIVYQRGLPFIWTVLAGGVGLIIMGLVLAGRVRRLGCFSLPEVAGVLYGPSVRKISAFVVILAEIGFLALLLRGAAGLLQPFVHVDPLFTLLSVAAVFTLYTVIGGQAAVARTDLIQLCIMALGIIVLLVFCFVAPAVGSASNQLTAFPFSTEFPPLTVLGLILVAGLPHIVGSDIYSKILSARDESVARISAIVSGIIKIGAAFAIGIIGLAAVRLLPAGLAQEEVLSTLFKTVLPEPASAVVLTAFLAALMSSADSVLLTAGTVASRDILGLSGRTGVLAGRVSAITTAVLATVLAAIFQTMLGIFMFAYTLFSAALVITILAGFWKRALGITVSGATMAMSGAAIIVVIATVAGWHQDTVTLAGLAACCTLLFFISMFTRNRRPEPDE